MWYPNFCLILLGILLLYLMISLVCHGFKLKILQRYGIVVINIINSYRFIVDIVAGILTYLLVSFSDHVW